MASDAISTRSMISFVIRYSHLLNVDAKSAIVSLVESEAGRAYIYVNENDTDVDLSAIARVNPALIRSIYNIAKARFDRLNTPAEGGV